MKQVVVNFIMIVAVSIILFFLFSMNASLDSQYVLSLLVIVLLQTSLILAILLKRK